MAGHGARRVRVCPAAGLGSYFVFEVVIPEKVNDSRDTTCPFPESESLDG